MLMLNRLIRFIKRFITPAGVPVAQVLSPPAGGDQIEESLVCAEDMLSRLDVSRFIAPGYASAEEIADRVRTGNRFQPLAMVLAGGMIILHWIVMLVLGSGTGVALISAGLCSAGVSALLFKLVRTHSYAVSLACYLVTGFNPIGLFVGYLATIVAGGAWNYDIGWRVVGLFLGTLIPAGQLPLYAWVGYGVAMLVFDGRKAGIITPLIICLALITLSSAGVSGFVLPFILVMSALGKNLNGSFISGMRRPNLSDSSAGKDLSIPQAERAVLDGSILVRLVGAIVLCLCSVGIGAGYIAKRFRLSDELCSFCDSVIEGWNLRAVLLLGTFVPQRTGLAETVSNLSLGYLEPASLLMIGVIILSTVLAVFLIVGCRPAGESPVAEGAVNVLLAAGATGFNLPLFMAVIVAALFFSRFKGASEVLFPMMPGLGAAL